MGGDSRDEPAIGIIAGPSNGDAVAGTVARAWRHGNDVLAIPQFGDDTDGVEIARELGVEILSLPGDEHHSSDPRDFVSSIARRRGYPGVVFVDAWTSNIDVERSISRCLSSQGYSIDALERGSTGVSGVLAGIPAYNEAETIADIVSALSEMVDGVLVVDDGSEDDTATLARRAGASVVVHHRNRGYGAALQTIFERAYVWGVDQLVILDGDGQHSIDDVSKLIGNQREGGADVLIGSRFLGSGKDQVPLIRRVGLRMINALTNVTLRTISSQRWLSDTQSGFRVYDGRAIARLATATSLGDGMGISIDIIFELARGDMHIDEVPTVIDYSADDTTMHNMVLHGSHLVKNLAITVEAERPILFVGLPGFLSVLIGLGFGYWTLFDFLNTPDFAIGLAITSTFFTLIGIFLVFTAIILHALSARPVSRVSTEDHGTATFRQPNR